VFERFTEPAHLVIDLARDEAKHFGHHYLRPEHLLLGVLTEGRSGAAQTLRAYGVDLDTARSGLRQLAGQGVVPPPRPSDAELLATLGIDLDAVRRSWSAWPSRLRWGRARHRDAARLGPVDGRSQRRRTRSRDHAD
jgi:ClpA/ClpB-like protein